MKQILLAGLLSIFLFINNELNAQVIQHQLQDVIVTASRAPISFSDLTRSVIVIDSSDIKETPVNSIQDLLQYTSGVDIKQRGVDGVQADASIRGGTFEETLILIDGVKMSDPQTAHHNLNLPISLDNVERIEILKGQGSKLFGPNAFSGVINIITKKNLSRSLSVETLGGQNSYYNTSLNASLPVWKISNNFSITKEKSDGYRYNTNFDMNNISFGSSLNTKAANVNLLLGYNDKKFGASGFYTSTFKNEWEHTTTKIANLSSDITIDNLTISPKLNYRRNDDRYLLDYTNPSFYENIHHTDVYGFEIQSSLSTNFGVTSIGGEFNHDKITSTNLGNHSRDKKGFFVEQKFSPVEKLNIIFGGFVYDYSSIGWKFWPGIDASYNLISNIRLFGSVGKAFRIPSYTELYYNDPVTQGDPNLLYEETTNFEMGLNLTQNFFNVELSLFRKQGKNIIDWFKLTQDETKWKVRNIAKVNTNGFEINFYSNPQIIFKNLPFTKIGVGYTYLDSDRKTSEFISRYALDYLRHQLVITISNNFFWGIKQSWAFRYENRVNFEDHFLADANFYRQINMFTIILKATNLFNKTYHDIDTAPLPGRWIIGGIKLKI